MGTKVRPVRLGVGNNWAPGAETHCAHPLPLCRVPSSRHIAKGQRKLVNKRHEYSSPSFPPFSPTRGASSRGASSSPSPPARL
ncbi:MAG: hypothetical protein BJ554DRAFT_6150 [Olpidium bornovanus]|uniref:Uncharacterized protein n=1 Tax=Olpidium bornovanus TaxID=278681 RepID=A0A8H7ZZ35_9FUNG|nr:MAG: hypothetical protein BJ554DRAFT_6150 [Olpidium bornovanus]